MPDIISELSQFITSQILNQPHRQLKPQELLVSSGTIDSLRLVDLALFVEEKYGVRIEDTELNRQTFDTLEQLAALVISRLPR